MKTFLNVTKLQHIDFAKKLLEEREKVYTDLTKTKKDYDAQCQTLESKRSKSERAYDTDKSRAQSSYDKHLHEANNAKVCSLPVLKLTIEYIPC